MPAGLYDHEERQPKDKTNLTEQSWEISKKLNKSSDITVPEAHIGLCIYTSQWLNFRRRQWHPTPVVLPGKSHGRRSLVGCSPWGRDESDTTERLHFHFSLSCIGEGNGNSLQCSCLENPRDRGAWWAAVYAVDRVGHDWSDLAVAAAARTWLSNWACNYTEELYAITRTDWRLKTFSNSSIFLI